MENLTISSAFDYNKVIYDTGSEIEQRRKNIITLLTRPLSIEELEYYNLCLQLLNNTEKEYKESEIKKILLVSNSSLFIGREYNIIYQSIEPEKRALV